MDYINVPYPLSEAVLDRDFGAAGQWYLARIRERMNNGGVYLNPLKTAYIWAAKDKQARAGYFKPVAAGLNRRKHKNYGGS